MHKGNRETGVERGAFPFPISDGPQESRYLTWVRNHANYMAVRGLLDYIRAVAVLLRGALVNALVGLPWLLAMSIVVAGYYVLPGRPGFHVSPWVLGFAAAAIFLIYPFFASLTKISGFRRSLGTGSDSTVKRRDRNERLFGALLIMIVTVAAFEAVPMLLDHFHIWAIEEGFKAPDLAKVIGAVMVVYSSFHKLMSILGGVAKKVAAVAVGALGLLIPLLIVLFVADFLVFARPRGTGTEAPLIAACLLAFGIVLVLIIGLVRRAFSRRDLVWLGGLFVVSIMLIGLVSWADDKYKGWSSDAGYTLHKTFEEASEDGPLKAELVKLAEDAVSNPGKRLKELEDNWVKFKERPLKPDRPPRGKLDPVAPDAGINDQLDYLKRAAGSAGLSAEPLVTAVRKAHDEKRLSPIEEEGAESELHNLGRMADATTTLLMKKTPSDLVDFVLNDRSRIVLFGRDDKRKDGKAFTFPVLSKNFTDEFDKFRKQISFWDQLVYESRLEIAARATPKAFPKINEKLVEFRREAFLPKATLISVVALLLWLFCWLTVDINLTSIHGLYRDRLATAFLIGADTKGDVDIEEDLDLGDLCRHEAGSTAPYQLINVALNLPGSRDIAIRHRRSDYFIFSKRFIGGKRTGYCRGEAMERVFPRMSLATAMAISAAAASPNMGRATSPALVALMTLLNVRLGVWIPNPGLLQDEIDSAKHKPSDDEAPGRGFSFEKVFEEELTEIQRRWQQLPGGGTERKLAQGTTRTVKHGLVGIGFSGGGIRSATVNLGIAQALHQRGVFDHIDYMSTVSGGGYVGSSISALMRLRTPTQSEDAGIVSVRADATGEKVVTITPDEPGWLSRWLQKLVSAYSSTRPVRPAEPREYRYASYAQLAVKDGDRVKAGQRLLRMGETEGRGPGSFGEQFNWRVRPALLLSEVLGWLDEDRRWVNVSDGGHIENLAGIELLRRRCKYIVIGDAEADPEHKFNGLATLIRSARIDLGVHIRIDVDALRLGEGRNCRGHWAIGRIDYPGEAEHGYLLYLKSSLTGDEDEVIREYRHASPTFPHESTADQMFGEGQFEAYRSLGQHIGEQVLRHLASTGQQGESQRSSFADMERWFATLDAVRVIPSLPTSAVPRRKWRRR